ncbi:MAG: hypothetical protein ABSG68_11370 [Thermoguttaceae bacterium]|jgi:hypothetical protein
MTAPLGSISLAQANLAATLADCPSFRAWLGLGPDDQAGALAKIHFEGLPAPDPAKAVNGTFAVADIMALRPCAVIYTAERQGFLKELEAVGDAFEYRESGRLVLRLYQNAPESFDDEPTSDANLQFRNWVGRIIDDLCSLSGLPGYLGMLRLSLAAGPFWAHPKAVPAQGCWQGVELAINWQGV